MKNIIILSVFLLILAISTFLIACDDFFSPTVQVFMDNREPELNEPLKKMPDKSKPNAQKPNEQSLPPSNSSWLDSSSSANNSSGLSSSKQPKLDSVGHNQIVDSSSSSKTKTSKKERSNSISNFGSSLFKSNGE